MRETLPYRWMILIYALALISGCGGGGGGNPAPVTTPTQPTKAVIKIATQGTPSNSPIGGVQITLHLPSGVTVNATQNAPQTDIGVVTASGVAASADLALGNYSTTASTLTVFVAKAASVSSPGFTVGEFATVNCDIAAGILPTSSSFSVSNLSAFDMNGALITGLTVVFTATIN